MEFVKMHGCGNDFIIIDSFKDTPPADLGAFAKHICNRHFGLGADGVLVVLPSDFTDVRMVIINSDGSEAQMCGNGIRCFASYVYEQGIVKKTAMTVETAAGIIKPQLIFAEDGKLQKVCVDMGIPRIRPWEIPVELEGEQVVGVPMDIDGYHFELTCVSMGNPHAVSFWRDLTKAPVLTLGPVLECHPLFPQKTNVEFVEIVDTDEIRMRVFERGVGETLACGTGAAASVVAAILNGYTDRQVKVHVLGGTLEYDWRADGHLMMTGPVVKVAAGVIDWE